MDWHNTLTRCGVRAATADRWAPVFADEVKPGAFSLGAAEVDDFLGQVLHESAMLERLEESLFYSPERLCAVWPQRFPNTAAAAPYARNPEALANHVYAGRLGNTQPGDGWRYRGRGLIQVTGRANYAALAPIVGLPLVESPDLLLHPGPALRASIAWWEGNVPDSVMGDIRRVTRAVNGGQHGLDDRGRLTARADGDGDGRVA